MDNIYYADAGFVFRRKVDGMIYGSEITLGYSYFLNGERLSVPHKDIIEDFEQIKSSEVIE